MTTSVCSGNLRCGGWLAARLEYLISSIMVAQHLIMFARDASGGKTNASYYSLKLQEASIPAE